MRQVSPNMVEAITAPETSEVFLYLLEITHEDLTTPLRVVNNYENIVSNGNTYLGTSFSFTPPTMNNGTMTPAKLTIDNTDRRITEIIRSITSAAIVNASVIMVSDPDTIEFGPLELTLKDVQYNVDTVVGTLYKEMYLDEGVSNIVMDNQLFPGLNEWI